MKIAGLFSFNGGQKVVQAQYSDLLQEIEECIQAIDAAQCQTKKSHEKTMLGKMLYAPRRLNAQFKKILSQRGWEPQRIKCEYPKQYYKNYKPVRECTNAFREIDFVKRKLGIEIQFGKYAFMVYNVAAKMTIFKNEGIIDTGIEIVPIKDFSDEMSSGVSYFEQFVWDLERRGTSDIDIPVLIIGIAR